MTTIFGSKGSRVRISPLRPMISTSWRDFRGVVPQISPGMTRGRDDGSRARCRSAGARSRARKERARSSAPSIGGWRTENAVQEASEGVPSGRPAPPPLALPATCVGADKGAGNREICGGLVTTVDWGSRPNPHRPTDRRCDCGRDSTPTRARLW